MAESWWNAFLSHFSRSMLPWESSLPSMGKGFGTAYTYNFTKILGLEGDFGHNWNDFGYESTLSVGPKLTWRRRTSTCLFMRLVGYNRFPRMGSIRRMAWRIFGGGMDLKVGSSSASACLKRTMSGRSITLTMWWRRRSRSAASYTLKARGLRTGLVFNFGGAPESDSCSDLLIAAERSFGRRAGHRDRHGQQLQSEAHA